MAREFNIRITSLEELKEWNAHPSEREPVLYDWFMPWFFDLLTKKRFKQLVEGYREYVRLAKHLKKDANKQLTTWSNRFTDGSGRDYLKLLIEATKEETTNVSDRPGNKQSTESAPHP
jgi:hypothetical protein